MNDKIIEEEIQMKKHHTFQFGIFALAVLLGLFSANTISGAATNPTVIGDWQGALDTGNGSVRLVVHITEDKNSKLTATMDSPDQGATGIAVSSISFKQPDLQFEVESLGGRYDGNMTQEGSEIVGNWKQGSASLALTLKRLSK
jgi:uncharacterized protein